MDKIAEGVEDTKIMASELGLDIDFKRFRKGNHKYLELNNLTSGLIERYYLTIQRKIISSLSNYQLKRLIKLCTYELQRRENGCKFNRIW